MLLLFFICYLPTGHIQLSGVTEHMDIWGLGDMRVWVVGGCKGGRCDGMGTKVGYEDMNIWMRVGVRGDDPGYEGII